MSDKQKSGTSKRIYTAIDIIKLAILNGVSVKESSINNGYSGTYVKNIKAMVNTKFEAGELDVTLYNDFNDTYSEYEIFRHRKKKGSVGETHVTFTTGRTYTENDILEKPAKVVESNKPRDIPQSGNRETFRDNGDSAEVEIVGNNPFDHTNYPNDHVKTLDQLLESCNVDTEKWAVKDVILNKWDVTSWKQGFAETKQNWQVKARLERDIKRIRERAVGEIFQEMTKGYTPPLLRVNPKNNEITSEDDNNLLEISIFDLHIGKLAWSGETFENYDVKIARQRFLGSIETLLKSASGFKIERILFPVGNDFFNSDNLNNTTTKGTPQDEDLRWQKTFNVGVQLLVDAIYFLKQTGVPIDVVVIPGNHDFERSYYMGEYLSSWFREDSVVNVNNGASPRKYYRYGNTLLGLTHGSDEKEAALPMLMATDIESKPMWSVTKFHEWHLGHIHRKRTVKYDINKDRLLNEDLGITVRYLSSLTGTEEWHHKKGFVGSTKAADGFVWNYKFGLRAHLNSNIILD